MANNQSVRRHLDAFTRGRIIGKLEEGRSVTSVAAEFELLTASFHDFGDNLNYRNSYPGFSSGRPRGTTPADDRYIVLQARRNRWQTAKEISDTRHRRPDDRYRVLLWLVKTARWWSVLHDALCSVVPLTPAHRRRRSLWCRGTPN
ncbi:hypothetical protein TNCV_3178191 [Trichonephila clavipes]|nr:hypothetical protein TNCV_3178191 [Trichonephila clavipes]